YAQGSRRAGSARAGELSAAHESLRLRHRFPGSGQADGRELFDRRNPEISERGFVGLLVEGRDDQGDGTAGSILLSSLLRRKLSGAGRSEVGEEHHGTPARAGGRVGRSAGLGRAANQVALASSPREDSTSEERG